MPAKKVLIVDDDNVVCQFIKESFEVMDDFEVYAAGNGREAIELTHKIKPDIILLDISMPEMDGFEVCEALNKDPLGASIPIIVTSAFDKEGDRVKAFKLGVVDFMVKPFQIEKLKKAVEKALEFKETQ